MRRAFLLPVVVLSFSACSAGDGTPETGKTATVSSPVINGVFDDGTTHDMVVQIATDVGGGRSAACTGTMITNMVIVTARHCISRVDDYTKAVYEDYDPAKMSVWLGNDPRGSPDGTVAKTVHNTATNLYDNDIALVVLTKPIGKLIAPIRLAAPPTKLELVTVVGYGLTTADTGTSTGFHKRNKRDGLRIQAVGPSSSYGIGANEIVMGESICSGDSGGPVFDSASGALLAVTSRGGNGSKPTSTQPYLACVGSFTINIFTRVDGFSEMIKKTVTESGGVVWEEGSPKPEPPPGPTPPTPGALGASCAGAGDCDSKICVEWAGKMVCSSECSDTTPCPAGFDCLGGYCIAGDGTTPPPDPPPDAGNNADPGTTSKGSCSMARPEGESPASMFVGLALAGLAVLARRRR